MRAWTVAVAVGLLAACSTVKLVQRDGCWIRQSKKPFGWSREELGPCARPASATTQASDDRFTRLVQECVAREDYRWQERTHSEWGRGEPWAKDDDKNVLDRCMSEANRSMLAENDDLKKKVESMDAKVAEVSKDRDDLRARSDEEKKQLQAQHDEEKKQLAAQHEQERKQLETRTEEERTRLVAQHDEERKELVTRTQEERKELISWTADERRQLLATQDKLADYLGEAAKKPLPPATATATATSEGRARTETETTGTTDATPIAPVVMAAPSVAAPPATVVVAQPSPTPAQVTCAAPGAQEASRPAPVRNGRLPRKGTTRALPRCEPGQAAAGTPAAALAAPPAAAPAGAQTAPVAAPVAEPAAAPARDGEAKALAAELAKRLPARPTVDDGPLTPAAAPAAEPRVADQGTGSGGEPAGRP